MTEQHDMTEADLRNFLAMRKEQRRRPANHVMPIVTGIYFFAGLLALDYFVGLTLAQYCGFALFCLGLSSLFSYTVKRAAKRGIGPGLRSITGPRTYTIGPEFLESLTRESRTWTRLDCITDLRSNARGTLVCLGEAHPLYLPFGNDYRPDFIAALRAAIPNPPGLPPLVPPRPGPS
jgi:hypothetical protein